jgi:hypothetical protein
MNNPFKHKLISVELGPNDWSIDIDSEFSLGPMTEEQAKYAAHAINQYEKLVEERDALRANLKKAITTLAGIEHIYPGRFDTGLPKAKALLEDDECLPDAQ